MPNPEVIYPEELPLEAKERAASLCSIPNGTIFVRARRGRQIPALHIEIYGEKYAIITPPSAVRCHGTKWGVKTNVTNHHIEYYDSEAKARSIAIAYGAGIYPPLLRT
jgi:hypothetical protein